MPDAAPRGAERAPSMMRPRHAGFTLVEVVVALSILSMVMLATVTGMRTLANTQVAVERLTGRVDEIRSVSNFLRDTLNSAVTGSGSGGLSLGGGLDDQTVFELTANALVWKAVVFFGEGFGGSYVLRVAREGDQLVLRWQEQRQYQRGREERWNNTPSRTLLDGVQSFELAARQGAFDAWERDWQPGTLPGWMRLRIRSQDRYWPDLIMQVAR